VSLFNWAGRKGIMEKELMGDCCRMGEFELHDYVKAVKSLHPRIQKGDIGSVDEINSNPFYIRVKWLTGSSQNNYSIVSDTDVTKITEDDYIAEIL